MQTFFLTNVTFSAPFCKVYLLRTQRKQIPYLIDKAIWGGVYVTYVANVDNRQRHVVTLGCSFKLMFSLNKDEKSSKLLASGLC